MPRGITGVSGGEELAGKKKRKNLQVNFEKEKQDNFVNTNSQNVKLYLFIQPTHNQGGCPAGQDVEDVKQFPDSRPDTAAGPKRPTRHLNSRFFFIGLLSFH